MGGPIDARKSPTAVNNLAMDKPLSWFENNVIYPVPRNFPGAGRRVYPGFLQHTGFVAMNPSNHAKSHYDYFQDLIKGDDTSVEAHRTFYDEYNAVLDMDADYYLETIRVVFQDYSLVNGTWDIKGVDGKIERVRPQDIKTTALFSVEGELDDISGSGQTEAVHTICTGVVGVEQRHFEVKGAGHYGIFSGRRWRDMVYPEVKAFILQHSLKTPVAATPAAKPAAPKVAVKAAVKAAPVAKPAAKVAAVAKPAAKAVVKPAPLAKAPVKVAVKAPVAKPAVKSAPVVKTAVAATAPVEKVPTPAVVAAAPAALESVAAPVAKVAAVAPMVPKAWPAVVPKAAAKPAEVKLPVKAKPAKKAVAKRS
jgi:poly(3-hydroxybutyrate) depolymerase